MHVNIVPGLADHMRSNRIGCSSLLCFVQARKAGGLGKFQEQAVIAMTNVAEAYHQFSLYRDSNNFKYASALLNLISVNFCRTCGSLLAPLQVQGLQPVLRCELQGQDEIRCVPRRSEENIQEFHAEGGTLNHALCVLKLYAPREWLRCAGEFQRIS